MKKIYLILTAFAAVVSTQAQNSMVGPQRMHAPRTVTAAEMQASRSASAGQTTSDRGGSFFYEDFANGFDGNNGVGAWTFEDSGGNTIWMVADASSPGGEFSTNIDPLESTTASNGWVIFDCDLYNTPISDGFEDVSGWLQAPALDCSTLESVVVEYEQYFRYCCFSPSPLTLEVSTDGGSNWTVFPAHGTFVQSANTLSANPLVTRVDVSCAAAGESNVLIRWGYNVEVAAGYSHYFWGLDDVTIYENQIVNDLEVVQVTNGDIFNIWEYRVTPFEQRVLAADGGLLAGVIYRNNGTANQEGTVITVEILDANDNVVNTTTSDAFLMESFANTPECPSFLYDTLYIETGWEPTDNGLYTVRATIGSNSSDEVSDNNVGNRVIEYTEYEYGHEDEAALDVEIGPRESDDSPGEFDPTGYGSFFTFPNDGSVAYGLTVQFGGTCDVGVEFAAVLYQANDNLNDSGEVIASDDFQVTEGQLNDAYHYYPFDDAVDMSTEEVYFCAVMNENTTPLQLVVAADSDSDNDNSTGVYEISGAGDFVWFSSQNWSPAVRLILSELVTVDEITTSENIDFFQISPNPAAVNARININLTASSTIAWEIRDMNGRLVQVKNAGRFPAGANNFDVNVESLPAGIYNFSIVVDGAEMFTKQLNVVR